MDAADAGIIEAAGGRCPLAIVRDSDVDIPRVWTLRTLRTLFLCDGKKR